MLCGEGQSASTGYKIQRLPNTGYPDSDGTAAQHMPSVLQPTLQVPVKCKAAHKHPGCRCILQPLCKVDYNHPIKKKPRRNVVLFLFAASICALHNRILSVRRPTLQPTPCYHQEDTEMQVTGTRVYACYSFAPSLGHIYMLLLPRLSQLITSKISAVWTSFTLGEQFAPQHHTQRSILVWTTVI